MKTIGILGGMTPDSTALYYEHIIRTYQSRFDDYAFPPIVIYSVSFQDYVDWMFAGKWDKIAVGLSEGMQNLEKAGAGVGVIATNTMHKVFDRVASSVSIPLISIIDATAENILEKKIKTVGLLGTIFTMEQDFYKEGLQKFGIEVVVPSGADQQTVNRIILDELGKGVIREESRKRYLDIIRGMQADGAEGIVLGCTEIPLLIQQEHCDIPVFDTTVIHAEKVLNYSLEE